MNENELITAGFNNQNKYVLFNKTNDLTIKKLGVKNFVDGIDWYRDNIWHNIEKSLPEKEGKYLVISSDKSIDIVFYHKSIKSFTFNEKLSHCSLKLNDSIVFWCDVNDIFPIKEILKKYFSMTL